MTDSDVSTEHAPSPSPSTPPVAAVRPVERTHHGDTVIDPYEWLRDKTDPEVIAHLEAENAWTQARTEHLAGLRQEIFDDINARTLQTDLSVPEFTRHSDGAAYWYYVRTIEGSDYPIWCRVGAPDRDLVPDPSGEIIGEQVLLDGNVEAEGHEFFSLGAFAVSPDGSQLAFSVDNSGDERFDLAVRDLTTGQTLGPFLHDIAWGASWAGNTHLAYTRVDEAWRPHQVWMHTLQTDPSTDTLIFAEADERYWVGVDESRDRNWLVIHNGSRLTSEALILPADQPLAAPRQVTARRENLDYSVEVGDGELFILHNADSPDFQISRAALSWQPDADELAPESAWTPVAGPTPGVRYTGVDAYRDFTVVSRRRDGLAGLQVHLGGEMMPVPFDEVLYEAQTSGSEDIDTDRFRLTFTSLVTPATVLEYRPATRQLTELKRTPVLSHPVHGEYVAEDYLQERQWVTASDGTQIPLSIVRHQDTPVDGTAPLLLYGYGSYEISIPPAFSIARLSLLDRGFIYVISHIRGGGEMGRAWYDDGKMLTKKNTFTDYVDSARWLVDQGYTSPERLAAEGRSAGGLLMGAIINLAPDLFRAVHAGVPFVDALTTILDPSLPLTVTEWEEWGDPLHDAEVYAYMKSYTPYENVGTRRHPAILATTGLNDTRVYYVEPAKWVARLRDRVEASAERPILLRTEMVAGHAGVTGRYDKWRELAFELAWLIDQVGTTTGAGTPR